MVSQGHAQLAIGICRVVNPRIAPGQDGNVVIVKLDGRPPRADLDNEERPHPGTLALIVAPLAFPVLAPPVVGRYVCGFDHHFAQFSGGVRRSVSHVTLILINPSTRARVTVLTGIAVTSDTVPFFIALPTKDRRRHVA